jgi:hypothetical protein
MARQSGVNLKALNTDQLMALMDELRDELNSRLDNIRDLLERSPSTPRAGAAPAGGGRRGPGRPPGKSGPGRPRKTGGRRGRRAGNGIPGAKTVKGKILMAFNKVDELPLSDLMSQTKIKRPQLGVAVSQLGAVGFLKKGSARGVWAKGPKFSEFAGQGG